MQVRREQSVGIYSIHAYNGDEAILNSPRPGEHLLSLRSSFIITPEKLQQDWPPESLANARGDDLATLTELDIDVFTATPLDNAGIVSFKANSITFDNLLTAIFEMQPVFHGL